MAFEERVWKETAHASADKVDFSFPFTNEGDSEVTIKEIKSSCGCTTAQLEKRSYAPGESGEITGVFRIGSRQGTQRKTVRLTTDSIAQPQILLTIEVVIPKLMSLEPGMVLWRKGEEPEVKTVRMIPNAELGVEVVDVTTEADDFSVSVLEAAEEETSSVSSEILVAALTTERAARGLIRITVRLPDGTEKPFFVHALVR